jgi:hypothetical protein
VHLIFSDTSPLKEFAKSLRCKQIVYIRNNLSANVYARTKGDIETCIQTHRVHLVCKHFVCVCRQLPKKRSRLQSPEAGKEQCQ